MQYLQQLAISQGRHAPLGAAWIPDTLGDDWGGFYDRHLVLDRNLAGAGLLNDWDILLHGFAAEWLKDTLQGQDPLAVFHDGINSELWLSIRLIFSGVPVMRFPSIAFVACQEQQWADHFDSKATMVNHRWSKRFHCREGGFRFQQEHAGATAFAACMDAVVLEKLQLDVQKEYSASLAEIEYVEQCLTEMRNAYVGY